MKDGENAIKDILKYVFNVLECDDYNKLIEETALQKLLKKELLKGKEFKTGLGVLKEEY